MRAVLLLSAGVIPPRLAPALLVALLLVAACSAHPTMSGGMPGASFVVDDIPDKAPLCIGAANRCLLLGCGCGISARCPETPEVLWCVARAKSCDDVEACRQ